MVFQYQYQYQYGYQVQPGYQPYMSYYQMLHDVPLSLSLVSLALVVLPFILYRLWSRGYIKPLYFYLKSGISQIAYKREKAEMEKRIKTEYVLFSREEKMGMGGIFSASGHLGAFLIILAVLKKMLFFSLILSESMMPTLYPSDLVLIEDISSDVQVGDIVVFQPTGEINPVIHRAMGVADGYITTKGDASLIDDDWRIPVSSILGKAVIIADKPVVLKNFGVYFMPQKIYVPGSDPTLEFIQDSVKFIHEYGLLVLVVIVFFVMVTGFEGKKYAKMYEV